MKKLFRKSYIDQIASAFENTKLVLLYGARQVGKTTLMQLYCESTSGLLSYYFNCEEFTTQQVTKQFLTEWLYIQKGFDLMKPGILCLDEVQVLDNPELLLKTLYDDPMIQTKIIATGSRFWGQKKVGSSLVGRGVVIHIYTFSFQEYMQAQGKQLTLQPSFEVIQEDIKKYMLYGGYPAVVYAQTHEEKYQALRSIVERIYDKDFVYYLDRKLLIDFKRVFSAICQNITSLIKLDSLAASLGVSKYFIDQFIHFLRDSMLIYTIFPYFTDKTKEYSSRPKLYLHDLGLLNYMRGSWNGEREDGIRNENFVLLQLLVQANRSIDDINFYKRKNGSEIDFLVRDHSGGIIPLEVKSSDKKGIPEIMRNYASEQGWETLVKTSKTQYSSQDLDGMEIITMPYWMVSV